MVRSYFVGKGIDPAKIKTIGMGEKDPLLPNTTPQGRAVNRRVEIELVPVGDR
jgi:outer membrane protein OmpA-like peptidoglycan-associated protein